MKRKDIGAAFLAGVLAGGAADRFIGHHDQGADENKVKVVTPGASPKKTSAEVATAPDMLMPKPEPPRLATANQKKSTVEPKKNPAKNEENLLERLKKESERFSPFLLEHFLQSGAINAEERRLIGSCSSFFDCIQNELVRTLGAFEAAQYVARFSPSKNDVPDIDTMRAQLGFLEKKLRGYSGQEGDYQYLADLVKDKIDNSFIK